MAHREASKGLTDSLPVLLTIAQAGEFLRHDTVLEASLPAKGALKIDEVARSLSGGPHKRRECTRVTQELPEGEERMADA